MSKEEVVFLHGFFFCQNETVSFRNNIDINVFVRLNATTTF